MLKHPCEHLPFKKHICLIAAFAACNRVRNEWPLSNELNVIVINLLLFYLYSYSTYFESNQSESESHQMHIGMEWTKKKNRWTNFFSTNRWTSECNIHFIRKSKCNLYLCHSLYTVCAIALCSFIYLWHWQESTKSMVFCRKNVHKNKLYHSPFDANMLSKLPREHLPCFKCTRDTEQVKGSCNFYT